MEAVGIIVWIMFGILLASSVGIISLHAFVASKAHQEFRLNPWHITGLAIAINGFALIGAILIPTSVSVFLLGIYISCSVISYVAFGIVIKTLVARLRDASKS